MTGETIARVESPAQVALRVDPSAARGLTLPLDANTWATHRDREVLWLGPDEWLVTGPRGSEHALVEELESTLAGAHHAVVDVSAARSVIELSGPNRFDLLAHGCGLDLHPRSWGAGQCAQTLLARVTVLLQERADATRVFVRPSYLAWLRRWLESAGGTG